MFRRGCGRAAPLRQPAKPVVSRRSVWLRGRSQASTGLRAAAAPRFAPGASRALSSAAASSPVTMAPSKKPGQEEEFSVPALQGGGIGEEAECRRLAGWWGRWVGVGWPGAITAAVLPPTLAWRMPALRGNRWRAAQGTPSPNPPVDAAAGLEVGVAQRCPGTRHHESGVGAAGPLRARKQTGGAAGCTG